MNENVSTCSRVMSVGAQTLDAGLIVHAIERPIERTSKASLTTVAMGSQSNDSTSRCWHRPPALAPIAVKGSTSQVVTSGKVVDTSDN